LLLVSIFTLAPLFIASFTLARLSSDIALCRKAKPFFASIILSMLESFLSSDRTHGTLFSESGYFLLDSFNFTFF